MATKGRYSRSFVYHRQPVISRRILTCLLSTITIISSEISNHTDICHFKTYFDKESITFLDISSSHYVITPVSCRDQYPDSTVCPCGGSILNCKGNCIIQINVPFYDGIRQFTHFTEESIDLINSSNLNITALTISRNNLFILDANILKVFPEIQSFDFSFNKIKYINLLHMDLPRLQRINGSFNDLETFDLLSFKIEELFLNNNNLVNVTFLSQLRFLRVLDMSYNNIATVSSDMVRNLSKLKCLSLQNNKIMKTSFLVHLSPNIVDVDLSNNRIKYINMSDIKSKPNLKALSLSTNYISEVDFSQIPRDLHYINLDNNQVFTVGLDTSLENKKLQIIYLRNNLIVDIKFLILGRCLREIYLSDNNLGDINGKYFKEIQKLEFIELSNTGLQSIDFISDIPHLQSLVIDRNNVTSIDQIFNTENLYELGIAKNPLGKLVCSNSNEWKIIFNTCNITSENELNNITIDLHMKNESFNEHINCIINKSDRKLLTLCKYGRNSALNKNKASTKIWFITVVISGISTWNGVH